MQALSILTIPEYIRKKLEKCQIGSGIDYQRFNIKKLSIFDKLPFARFRANNTDNSNITYDKDVAYLRINNRLWVAHNIIISVEWIWPVPIIQVLEYRVWENLAKQIHDGIAKVDFYGAFFLFMDIIPERYLKAYHQLLSVSIEDRNAVSCTRIDVAIDFAFPFPQQIERWITPCSLSKRPTRGFTFKGKKNGILYDAQDNKWYWVRVYDKLVDVFYNTKNKWTKVQWYGGRDKLPEHWTRFEFEFYTPYSDRISSIELISAVQKRIIGKEVSIGIPFRPSPGFQIENAYQMITQYAKRIGVDVEFLLNALLEYHKEIQLIKN